MNDRLSMLAEEFRLYKVETDDRLARLEATLASYIDPNFKAADNAPAGKKSTDAAS